MTTAIAAGARSPIPLRPHLGQAGNVPYEVSSFIGRDSELSRVRDIQAGARLLTLVGPSGVGKTRFALRLQAQIADSFPDGTWLVDLTPTVDPALVGQAVGDVLGVRQQPGHSWLSELTRVLRARRLLLVLDNCEQLVGACCELVEELLRACPDMRILATSLQPLGATGEIVWRVPPLRLPPAVPNGSTEIEASEAVRLFVARVRARLPDFTLDKQNEGLIADICRRLDGLPLALELVAARTESLGLSEVAARLNDRFALAVGTSHTAPARQRTLQAAIEWSCSLLVEDEHVLLRRSAVFVGGWTLEAAERVCAGGQLARQAVVVVLEQLVSKSLVVAEHRDLQVRYRLLESVRAYALTQLGAADEESTLQRLRAKFMLERAERAWPEAIDSFHGIALIPEEDNLRAALEWAYRHDQSEFGLRLATASFSVWRDTAHYAEGCAWFDRILALPPAPGTRVRGAALTFAAQLRLMLGDYALANELGEAALELQSSSGDAYGLALTLEMLGNLALQRGDLAKAAVLHADSLSRKREVGGSRQYPANNLQQLASVAHEFGDTDRVRELAADIDTLGQAPPEPVVQGMALEIKALLASSSGDARARVVFLEKAVELHRQAGFQQALVRSLTNLGHARLDQMHGAEALEAFAEAMHLARASGERIRLIRALEGCARGIATSGAEAAVRLAGAVHGQRQALGARLWPSEQRYFDDSLAAARRVLGQNAYQRAWDDGHLATLDQAVNLAEAILSRPTSPAPRPGSLSAREQEVASLIARGLTNKEIAAELVVSPATVRSHVEHILGKLDLRTRGQVAVWASQQGLVTTSTVP